MPKLTSRLRHLAFLNYEAPSQVLGSLLPEGLLPDDYYGTSYVTVLAYVREQTRWWRFPLARGEGTSVELCAPVKQRTAEGWRKGLYFFPALASEPRVSLGIHFEEGGIDHMGRPFSNGVYDFEWRAGEKTERLYLKATGLPQPAGFSPEEAHLLNRGWVYRRGWVTEITHPEWFYWEAGETRLEVDLERRWGRSLAALITGKPAIAFVAKGSSVTLLRPRRP